MGSLELGKSGFSKWRAISNSLKNWRETGIIEEVAVEIKDKGQQNRW